ncbi:MAG: recombinase family protein, partial [Caulobacteraceae bacterium]
TSQRPGQCSQNMPPINTGDRKELGKLLQSLAAGDQVLTTRIDRLAQSAFELFAIVKKSSARGQSLNSAAPWAKTSGYAATVS